MTSLLVCQVDRGNPPADVTWLHVTYDEEDQQVIAVITESWNERFTAVENGLEIADVRSTDEGLYRCYVQNSHGIEALDIQAAFRGTLDAYISLASVTYAYSVTYNYTTPTVCV